MIQVSLCVVSCLVLGLGLLVWRARPEAPSNRSFGAFTLFSAIWVLGVGLFYAETIPPLGALPPFAGASLVPAASLSFVRYYPPPTKWLGAWPLRLNFSIGLLSATASFTPRLIVKDVRIASTGPARETGALY